MILVVLHVWDQVVGPTRSRPGSMPVTMLQGIAVSYYNSMNNHTTKMRMPNTHIFLSRSAIKYAVNIYQILPTRTKFVHVTTAPIWLVWWQAAFAHCATPLVVLVVTRPYQTLPFSRSGSAPPMRTLYQGPSPHERRGRYIHGL